MHSVKQIGSRWAVVRENIIFPEDKGSIVCYCDDLEEAAYICERLNKKGKK